MKKIYLLFVPLVLMSCQSQEEKMFTEFKQKEVNSTFKTKLDELNFEIESFEKVKDITVTDSIAYYKNLLADLYSKDIKPEVKDTLSYRFVINTADKLINSYHEMILYRIENGKDYLNYSDKKERDEWIGVKTKLIDWETKDIYYHNLKDSILGSQYKVAYSMQNPMLNIKQSFNKMAYTSKKTNSFITEEEIQ